MASSSCSATWVEQSGQYLRTESASRDQRGADQGPSGNEEREATLYFNLNSFNCLSLTGDGAPAIRSTA